MSDNKGTRFYLLDYDFFVIFFYIHVWKTGRNQHMGYLKKQNINNNRMKGRVTKSRGGAACWRCQAPDWPQFFPVYPNTVEFLYESRN